MSTGDCDSIDWSGVSKTKKKTIIIKMLNENLFKIKRKIIFWSVISSSTSCFLLDTH
jgi:hypothetical protein